MHSSASVTCRALAMLTCAIAIPLVAIFGGPLCDLGHRLWTAGKAETPQHAEQLGSDAPRFECSIPVDVRGSAWAAPSNPPRWPDANSQRQEGPAAQGSSVASSAAHRTRDSIANASAVEPNQRPLASAPRQEAILASYETAAGHQPRPVCPDEAENIQRRLRQLGAVYYVLESWGSEGNYRFACRIAIDGNPEYTRYFEATGRDGLSVMSRVLQQVEAWRQFR